MRTICHFRGEDFVSSMTSMLPTVISGVSDLHFCLVWRVRKYSSHQSYQNECTHWLTRVHQLASVWWVIWILTLGTTRKGWPIKKWPGVRQSTSRESGRGGSGCELRMDSTWQKIVPYSSRVKVCSPIIRTINLFTERTIASHKLSKCGALGWFKCHVHGTFAVKRSSASDMLSKPLSFLTAPTKLVPQSV